jgi:hypothetical protein
MSPLAYLAGHAADPAFTQSADETDPKGFKALLDFTREHGQSLDYVLSGELESLFCMLTALSPRTLKRAA